MANAADISFRSPKSSIAVLPIFRQDATPIPDYFLDQVLSSLTSSEIKIALVIFRLMHKSGEDEILTYRGQLADLANVSETSVKYAISMFREKNIFDIEESGITRKGVSHSLPSELRIKFNNLVNYKKSGG